MLAIGQFIKNKLNQSEIPKALDDKTIFFIFEKIIKEEYGNAGYAKLKPDYYKNGKLFIKSQSSNWAGELWTNRSAIVAKLNQEIGGEEVREIKVN